MTEMPHDQQASPVQAVVTAQGLVQEYRVGGGWFRAGQTLRAVSGVGFSIAAGRTLAVVGESGCGKSTLARMVSLIEAPGAGRLVLDGQDVTQANAAQRRALRQKVQLVFQNPFGSLNPRKRIGHILEAPLEINRQLTGAQRRAQAIAMLLKVGLRPEHYERYAHMFSGGQRQRIAIARALMLQPALLVADEPVSALDVSVQAQVLNLLAELQRDLGLAYLFISHDLAVVRHIADEVMVMYLGHTMEQGEKNAMFERPLHPYTQALMASTPVLTFGAKAARRTPLSGELPSPLNPPAGCVFSTRCPMATARCHAERPKLEKVDDRLVACHEVHRMAQCP